MNHDALDRFLADAEPGTTLRDPGFAAADTHKPWGGNVEMRIDSAQGRDISDLSESRYFHEVLFKPDAEFRVTGREWDPEQEKWIINLTD